MNQITGKPTAKMRAAGVGGLVATTSALVAAGVSPHAALAGALVATLLGLIPAYFISERD